MFNNEDILQIEARGLSVAEVEKQIENFRKGFPSLPIVRAAAGGDGVLQLSDEEVKIAEAQVGAAETYVFGANVLRSVGSTMRVTMAAASRRVISVLALKVP